MQIFLCIKFNDQRFFALDDYRKIAIISYFWILPWGQYVFVFPRVCGHPAMPLISPMTHRINQIGSLLTTNHFVQTTRQMASMEKWNDANARKALVVCIYFQSFCKNLIIFFMYFTWKLELIKENCKSFWSCNSKYFALRL